MEYQTMTIDEHEYVEAAGQNVRPAVMALELRLSDAARQLEKDRSALEVLTDKVRRGVDAVSDLTRAIATLEGKDLPMEEVVDD
jgi:hypothetical protein